jgi:hypothetical protein
MEMISEAIFSGFLPRKAMCRGSSPRVLHVTRREDPGLQFAFFDFNFETRREGESKRKSKEGEEENRTEIKTPKESKNHTYKNRN